MKQKLKRFIKRIWINIGKPEMLILPGQLAFFFVLSLVPIISLIGIIGALFSVSVTNFIDVINNALPNNISSIIIPFVQGEGLDTKLSVFLMLTFILASNGAYSIIVSSNMLYNIKESNELKRRIKAVLMTIIIVTLLIFLILVPAFGDYIMNFITDIKLFKGISNQIYFVFQILRWPLSLLFIYINIKLIYTIAPDVHIKSKEVTYGAIFTSVFWVIATSIFSYYVDHFSNYDLFYGSLSNIIALMLWIYMLSYIFVLGMALNASKQKIDETFTDLQVIKNPK
jgi:membrane protein